VQLPALPEDPSAVRTAWVALAFLGGIFIAAVAVFGLLLRARKTFDDLVKDANRDIASKLDQLNVTAKHSDERITELDRTMISMSGDLKAMIESNRRVYQRVDELERRIGVVEVELAKVGAHRD
jgi:hypothetical protein